MLWIKRNLFLVVFAVVSLALLGGAVYYVYNAFYDNDDQDVALEQLKAELQQIQGGIYPSEENISLVKSNTMLAEAFMNEANRLLAAPAHKSFTSGTFSSEVAKALDRLRRDATNYSVEIPPKYKFTFGEIEAQSRILSYAVEPLAGQLAELGTICGVLFKAKVRALESLQRVPAYPQDPGGADLITDLSVRTNVVSSNVSVIITPYRVTFRGFVGELTAVLNGLAQTKEFIVVRQLDLEAGGAALPVDPVMLDPTMMMTPPGGLGGLPPGFGVPGAGNLPVAAPAMITPPGGVGIAAPRPVTPPRPGIATGPPPPKSSLTPILDEKPLRVTMVLDVIKVVRRPAAVAAVVK